MEGPTPEELDDPALDDYLTSADRSLPARGFERMERYEKRSFEPALERVYHFASDRRHQAMVQGRNSVLHGYHEAWISITPFSGARMTEDALRWQVERIGGLIFAHINRTRRHAGARVANLIVVVAALDDLVNLPGDLPHNVLDLMSALPAHSRRTAATRSGSIVRAASLFLRASTSQFAPWQSPPYVNTLPVLAVADTGNYFYARKSGLWPFDGSSSIKQLADASIGSILRSYEQRRQWITERDSQGP